MKNKHPYIIAEVGINHDGNFLKAKKLISLAKKCGASAVKFQLFKAQDLYIKNTNNFRLIKKFELSYNNIKKLRDFSKIIQIDFICTPFSLDAAKFLKKIKADAIKIASMDATNYVLISACLKLNLPIIISTGMCDLKEVKELNSFLSKRGAKNVSILHCVSSYPCKIKDANLLALINLKKIFPKKFRIGYSDHTIGTVASITAIIQGAEVIEKHFTYNVKNKLDHIHSADERDLRHICDFANYSKKYLGLKNFFDSRSDKKNRNHFRRGLYAKKCLKKNDLLNKNLINFVRPNKSGQIELSEKIFNSKINKNVKKNEIIEKKYINNL